ncbi:hypothetical protein JR316_0000680 [Psilocybe cubensis]|uniref:Uncharacterized protein n=2 Tax=Psilocybe cubensis TaxID=181762 RepID=A0ACB8HFW1_PSICU|nr:hypothetical protein JR316_0000680 [Psilocybe cubensis]KAH9486615.1 hypothetical protein JR316_0000680 [Psilocybe cubensis]
MYRSPTSQDTHHDHLRDLLDQRSARADIQGRFSSADSEYTDTPSVYSRTNFSPRVLDHGGQDLYRDQCDGPEPISPYLSRSKGAHNRVQGQPTSMLGLVEDSRFSSALSGKNDDEQPYAGEEDEVETDTRMSYLGPKMRFHSRAPWEMEGDTLEEEDDLDQPSRHFQQGHLFGRSSGSKFDSSRSSSPRPSFNSRPSGESLYSQIPPKRSFETINSQMSYPRGALYALAQESLSTNSLTRPALPTKENKDTVRNKFSFGRLKPDPPAVSLPQSPIRGRFPTSPGAHEQPSFKFESHTRSNNTYYANKSFANSTQESMHPYANPDLVVSYADDDTENFTSQSVQHPRNDSSITIMESSSTDSMIKSSSRATLTPDTSVNSISSKHRASSILTKTISSPVPVLGSSQRVDSVVSDTNSIFSLQPSVNNLPGWTERNTPPTFSLISLEEARAQRTRSSTVTVPTKVSSLTGVVESSTSFPYGDIESATNDSTPLSRTRARSISAGAKAKNAIQGSSKPQRRDSASSSAHQIPAAATGTPGTKGLKHKKSGFMRLFNGGKSLEKEEQNSPPPVPSLPETVVPPQLVQRTPKNVLHRIPVPSLPPTSTAFENSFSEPSERDSLKLNLSPKRTPPPSLSINTISQGVTSRSSTSDLLPFQRPFLNEQPQSAPAHVSEFPALRLRPVSTLFSDHFKDHIVTGDSRSSDETTDLDTPRSPSPGGLMSPVTPASALNSNNDKNQASLLSSEEDSKLRALQEEFDSSKQAWQRHIWELEGQVRDLKLELAESKTKNTGEYCHSCGRGVRKEFVTPTSTAGSILNRPRARTGVSSRFGNALP